MTRDGSESATTTGGSEKATDGERTGELEKKKPVAPPRKQIGEKTKNR